MVERHLAKVNVASSNLVFRSRKSARFDRILSILFYKIMMYIDYTTKTERKINMSRTEVLIKKDYIVLPISNTAIKKTVCVYSGGELFDDFRLRLDYINPDYYTYYCVKEYKGDILAFEVSPEMDFCDMQTDEPDYTKADSYKYRPHIHFTPRFGWMNDPNGLVEYISPVTGEKKYHMFFQYNPYDTEWGNMHWGHAVSSNLFDWEEKEIALFPDKYGAMFSGGGIVDKENKSGLKNGYEDVILVYYTAAGGSNKLSKGQPFTQNVAYSTDGGKTFKKYEKNPIIENVIGANRDPKVVWCDEMKCYVLAIYLTGGVFELYTSDNLLDWKKLQQLRIEGDRECPDFYPLCTNGDKNDTKWVFSGANQLYMICECDGKKFNIIQDTKPLEYGKRAYATQSFANASDGRCITLSWASSLTFPQPYPFYTQMSIPFERTLKKIDGEYYLCVEPAKEIQKLYTAQVECEALEIGKDAPFELDIKAAPYDIEISLEKDSAGKLGFDIFGCDIEIDVKSNLVRYTPAGYQNENSCVCTMPLSVDDSEIKVRVIVDRCSLEIISADGTAVMSVGHVCDYNLARIKLSADKNVGIKKLVVHEMRRKNDE